MKISVYKEGIHVGIQPIRTLKHNITHRLVERSEDFIKELYLDKRLAQFIKYHAKGSYLKDRQTPYIDENGVINIHETFLSYIWIISFTIFILYEEGIAIPDQIIKGLKPYKNQNPELIEIAKELFDYAKSLIVSYSPWDKDYFPNPEFYDSQTIEGWYIERTNDIYVETMNFILFHEIAHAENKHLRKKKEERLEGDELKKLELEADTRAIELILKGCRNQNVTEISILVGLASMLFCRRDLSGDNEHPNIDVRINNYLSIIKPANDSVIWGMLVVFLKLWDEQFSHNFVHGKIYNDFREMYYEISQQIK